MPHKQPSPTQPLPTQPFHVILPEMVAGRIPGSEKPKKKPKERLVFMTSNQPAMVSCLVVGLAIVTRINVPDNTFLAPIAVAIKALAEKLNVTQSFLVQNALFQLGQRIQHDDSLVLHLKPFHSGIIGILEDLVEMGGLFGINDLRPAFLFVATLIAESDIPDNELVAVIKVLKYREKHFDFAVNSQMANRMATIFETLESRLKHALLFVDDVEPVADEKIVAGTSMSQPHDANKQGKLAVA